jgi:putative flippase GtrA
MNLPAFAKKAFNISFIRFLFVAGINTVFGYLVFSATVFVFKKVSDNVANKLLSANYVYVSVAVATIIAVLFNFKTYGSIVFNSKDNSKILRFFGVYLCTMSIQMMLLKGLSRAGIPNPYIAGGIILLPVALLSFFLMRRFVYRAGAIEKENRPT